jgi:hypothetical protein
MAISRISYVNNKSINNMISVFVCVIGIFSKILYDLYTFIYYILFRDRLDKLLLSTE